jgi:hypothetical protein
MKSAPLMRYRVHCVTALTGVQGRLARTHPSLTMGFGQAAD